MSLALLHQQCSRKLNGVGPLLSDMELEEKEPELPSNHSSPPPPAAVVSCSTTTSAAIAPPSWLLTTLADIEERVKLLSITNPQEADDAGQTFAKRAESYYEKRPQLLSLLQDLYKAYVSLSDRYLHKTRHSRHSSLISTEETLDFSSDAESSVSFQLPPLTKSFSFDIDALVAELVMKNVECELLGHEVRASEEWAQDRWARKIELQRSLLEVLESERLILLNENARLGYRVAALAKDNRDLASECVFVKREASELARCLIRMREDQRMLGLARKIEDLQGQICKLEVRNKEHYKQLKKKEPEAAKGKQTAELKVKPNSAKKVFGWWERVKKMDPFMCGIHSESSC